MVYNVCPGGSGSYPQDFVVMGGWLYFTATDCDDGYELWKTDGNPGGGSHTLLVKDILPGSGSSYPFALTVVSDGFDGELLYFSANDGSFGYELWRSDGTEQGTIMVKDIRYGGDSGLDYTKMYAVGDILLFTADDGFTGQELYWNSFPETNIFYE